MKKSVYTILMAAMCAASLTLTGCGGDGEGTTVATVTTTTTTSTTAIATTTTTDSAETTYITVTGEDGAAVTDADGAAVTSAIAIDPATTATDAATTAADTTTTTTTTTAAPVVVTTPAPVAQTTTETTTTTTAAPTTAAPTTAADTRPTVVDLYGNSIQLFPEDPWKYPYDVEACRKDCKEYIESLGIKWDESIGLENSTWAGNILTDVYTRHPDRDLKKMYEKIDFEAQSWSPDAMNVIWVPRSVGTEYGTSALDGNYEIYVVMG